MKFIDISKIVIFISFGILVIIFRDFVADYLAYVIGIMVIVLNLENLYYDFKYDKSEHMNNKIAEHFAYIIIGIVMCIQFVNKPGYVCIVWAGIIIIENANRISKFIYLKRKGHNVTYLSIIEEVISFILAVILLIDPIEHVGSHIIILGIEMLLDGSRLIINAKNNYEPKTISKINSK